MGFFGSRIEEATGNMSGTFWLPGIYLVTVNGCKAIKGRKNVNYFIVNGANIESNNPDCAVGATRDWVCNLDNEPGVNNARQFIAAAANIPFEQVDGAGSDAVISSDNPLHGVFVRLEVVTIKTKAGTPFSKHSWFAVTEDKQKQAKELRDKAGLPPF